MIRLVPETNYYVTSSSEILFIEPGKKIIATKAETYLYCKGTVAVKKGTLKDSSGFSVKILDGMIYVSHPDIMKGDWLKLSNQDENNISAISEFCEVNKGQVVGSDFDLAFQMDEVGDQILEKSWMISKEMNDLYLKAWKEFTRRMNFTFKKKTKKYLPGHRYDSESKTLWYIGEIRSPLPGSSNLKSGSYITRHGFVNRPVGKTLKETLESIRYLEDKQKIGDIDISSYENSETTLFLISTSPLMSDSGQELDPNPIIKPYEVWESWIDGLKIEKSKANCWEDCPDTVQLYSLLQLMTDTSGGDISEYDLLTSTEVKDRIKTKLSKLLESYIRYNIIVSYMGRDVYNKDLKLKSSDDFATQVKAIMNLIVYEMPCIKSDCNKYLGILNELGINLGEIAEKALNWYIRDFSMDNFDMYYKYQKCLDNDKALKKGISLYRDHKTDEGSLRASFKHQDIAEAVVNMVRMANESLGLVKDFFSYLGVYRYSKKAEPNITLKINLINLVNWFGGPDKMSNVLKEKILDEKFYEIDVSFTRGTEFK